MRPRLPASHQRHLVADHGTDSISSHFTNRDVLKMFSCWEDVHVKFEIKLTKNSQTADYFSDWSNPTIRKCMKMHTFAACFFQVERQNPLKSTYGRLRLQVEIKMNHGSEPAMFEHHVWVLLINFVVSTSCVFMHFLHFFDRSNRSNRLEVDLDWGRGSRGGASPCCGDTLALPSTEEKWLSCKQPSSM